MSDSHIHVSKAATSFVGTDAVELFRVTTIASALRFYAKTGMKVNRAYTPTAMLKAASAITHKHYKRGDYEKAAPDLQTWADAMKAALPITKDPDT